MYCAGVVKFLWFFLFAGNYDLNDIAFFYPLSLINIFSQEEVSRLWITPLQTLNIFHLVYIMVLSHGLTISCKIEKRDADNIVLSSYLPGLVLWIAFIMFLTIDIAP
ncbi:MAG: hypothetical protein MZV63_14665 [Marinilabiliales bacterium]|nr:hypothetical protein [Marinilabiliales bacterium]